MKIFGHEQSKKDTIPVSRLQQGGYKGIFLMSSFYPREGLRQGPLNALAGHPCNQGVRKEKKAVAAIRPSSMPGTTLFMQRAKFEVTERIGIGKSLWPAISVQFVGWDFGLITQFRLR
jgi:hypothetical protein